MAPYRFVLFMASAFFSPRTQSVKNDITCNIQLERPSSMRHCETYLEFDVCLEDSILLQYYDKVMVSQTMLESIDIHHDFSFHLAVLLRQSE